MRSLREGQLNSGALWLRSPAIEQAARNGLIMVLGFSAVAILVQRFDAMTVLAVAIIMTGLLFLLARPELATLLMVFLLYINFPAILTKQLGMPRPVAGSFILLLGIPLVAYVVRRRAPLKVDSTFYLMLGFLAALVISTFQAVDRGIATAAVQEYIAEGVLLYWLIINVVRSSQTLRRVFGTLLVAGSLLAALSLFQTATGSYEQEFGGLALRNYDTAGEIVDRETAPKRRTWDRAQGPIGQPNRFAQALVVLVPLAVYMFRTAASHRARVMAAASGFLLLGGIAATLSRGGFVTLLVIILFMAGLKWIRFSGVVAFACIVAATAPAVPFFAQRISTVVNATNLIGSGDPSTRAQAADGAMLGRTTLMLSAWHVFLDHPVIGVGPGQFPPFYSVQYSANPDIKFRQMPDRAWRAHSLYLELAAETGVIGLALFLAAVGVLLRGLWRMRRYWLPRSAQAADLATALWLVLFAYMSSGVIQHLAYQRYFWLLVGLAGAGMHVLRSLPRSDAAGTHAPNAPGAVPPNGSRNDSSTSTAASHRSCDR